jgi:hypothetical protein
MAKAGRRREPQAVEDMPEADAESDLEAGIERVVRLAAKLRALREEVSRLHSDTDAASVHFLSKEIPEPIRKHVVRAVDDISTGFEKLDSALNGFIAAIGYHRLMKGD